MVSRLDHSKRGYIKIQNRPNMSEPGLDIGKLVIPKTRNAYTPSQPLGFQVGSYFHHLAGASAINT